MPPRIKVPPVASQSVKTKAACCSKAKNQTRGRLQQWTVLFREKRNKGRDERLTNVWSLSTAVYATQCIREQILFKLNREYVINPVVVRWWEFLCQCSVGQQADHYGSTRFEKTIWKKEKTESAFQKLRCKVLSHKLTRHQLEWLRLNVHSGVMNRVQ